MVHLTANDVTRQFDVLAGRNLSRANPEGDLAGDIGAAKAPERPPRSARLPHVRRTPADDPAVATRFLAHRAEFEPANHKVEFAGADRGYPALLCGVDLNVNAQGRRD